MDQQELDKRVKICSRKIENFISRMVVDFGILVLPVKEINTLQGTIDELGKFKFVIASDSDVNDAVQILDEADKRYKERKNREKTPVASEVSQTK